MSKKANLQQRWKSQRIYQYEVAAAAGISENTLIRWLRVIDNDPQKAAVLEKATASLVKGRK